MAVRGPALPPAALRAGPAQDLVIRRVDKLFPLWVALGLVIPFLAGLALSGGSVLAGLTAFVWAGLRVFLLHHATWSVNSICHMYGRRPSPPRTRAATTGLSRSYRSAKAGTTATTPSPTSARHGLRRTQIDPSYAVIRVLERLGLVWNVKQPRPEQIAAKQHALGMTPLATADRSAA